MKSVLIVEDNSLLQRLCRRMMSPLDYETIVVGSLAEGKELLKNSGFDLLITDLKLPDGNGSALIVDYFEKQPKGSVIIMSGAPTQPAKLSAQYPNNRLILLTKPFSLEEFQEAVKRGVA